VRAWRNGVAQGAVRGGHDDDDMAGGGVRGQPWMRRLTLAHGSDKARDGERLVKSPLGVKALGAHEATGPHKKPISR